APAPAPATVQHRSIAPPHWMSTPKSPSTAHPLAAEAATGSLTCTADMIDLLVRAVSILGRAAPRACCEPPRPRAVASHRPMAYGHHSWPSPSCCGATTAASPP